MWNGKHCLHGSNCSDLVNMVCYMAYLPEQCKCDIFFVITGSEHDLTWIPKDLPPNVFLLLSTLPGRVSRLFSVIFLLHMIIISYST